MFVGHKVTAVDHHPLTAAANRRYPTILWLGDKAVAHVEREALRCENDRTRITTTLEINVIENKLRQIVVARKVEHVFEAREAERLSTGSPIKRLA